MPFKKKILVEKKDTGKRYWCFENNWCFSQEHFCLSLSVKRTKIEPH